MGVCVREPPDRDTPYTVKERAVHIILECILVIEKCVIWVSVKTVELHMWLILGEAERTEVEAR